jgi:hypothetical protein
MDSIRPEDRGNPSSSCKVAPLRGRVFPCNATTVSSATIDSSEGSRRDTFQLGTPKTDGSTKKVRRLPIPKRLGKQTTSGGLSFPIGARALGKRSTRTISGLAVSKNREAFPSSFEDPTQSVGGPTPNRASPHAAGNLVESFDLDVSEVNFATRIMCL